jgi:hypothetical protein
VTETDKVHPSSGCFPWQARWGGTLRLTPSRHSLSQSWAMLAKLFDKLRSDESNTTDYYEFHDSPLGILAIEHVESENLSAQDVGANRSADRSITHHK